MERVENLMAVTHTHTHTHTQSTYTNICWTVWRAII